MQDCYCPHRNQGEVTAQSVIHFKLFRVAQPISTGFITHSILLELTSLEL